MPAPINLSDKITVQTNYLEMLQPPVDLPPEIPPGSRVEQVYEPLVSFYRYLYNSVGGPWFWVDRRRMSDSALAAIIQNPQVEIHLLSVQGQPAGFCELDGCSDNEIEIAYFGLIPDLSAAEWDLTCCDMLSTVHGAPGRDAFGCTPVLWIIPRLWLLTNEPDL
jgi:hypothetical protein